MGLIQETIKHPTIIISIKVCEFEKGEINQAGYIVSLDTSGIDKLDTVDLRDIGEWLIEQADYISKTYTPKGRKKGK